jgi:hypothetical protein
MNASHASVRLCQTNPVVLTAAQMVEVADQAEWIVCKVPTLLGLPLSLTRVVGTVPTDDERMAVLMLVDPVTGFAPSKYQCGLGEVLVARRDGEDLSSAEMWELWDYNCYLMDLWPDWLDDPVDGETERNMALTPDAYAAYTQERA